MHVPSVTAKAASGALSRRSPSFSSVSRSRPRGIGGSARQRMQPAAAPSGEEENVWLTTVSGRYGGRDRHQEGSCVIVADVVAICWSFWLGIVIGLVGVPVRPFGGFARGRSGTDARGRRKPPGVPRPGGAASGTVVASGRYGALVSVLAHTYGGPRALRRPAPICHVVHERVDDRQPHAAFGELDEEANAERLRDAWGGCFDTSCRSRRPRRRSGC